MFGANKKEVNPQNFQGDLVVVGATQLLGIVTNPKSFQWLRENKKPVYQCCLQLLSIQNSGSRFRGHC